MLRRPTPEQWNWYVAGVGLLKEFCSTNALQAPEVLAVGDPDWQVGACAYYRPGSPRPFIKICVEHCAHIGRAGRSWSYPGWMIDRTPYGVLQHELGHHVDHSVKPYEHGWWGTWSAEVRVKTAEAPISGYGHNEDHEWFAEMFRLFVTNPHLMKKVRPETYREIHAVFTPVEHRPWEEVLAGAPERTQILAHTRVYGATLSAQ